MSPKTKADSVPWSQVWTSINWKYDTKSHRAPKISFLCYALLSHAKVTIPLFSNLHCLSLFHFLNVCIFYMKYKPSRCKFLHALTTKSINLPLSVLTFSSFPLLKTKPSTCVYRSHPFGLLKDFSLPLTNPPLLLKHLA